LTAPLVESAPAKINLTLRVLRRRDDGYHEIESLVAFADVGDKLSLSPGEALSLRVHGTGAAAAGHGDDNLVLKAARALRLLMPGIRLGAFELEKNLPVAAGLGGGSADAAAALRLLARTNALAPDARELYAAARATGADVPVCLDPRPRIMRGIGELLSAPLPLPALPALLVNPGIMLPTKSVFARFSPLAAPAAAFRLEAAANAGGRELLLQALAAQSNDLEPPALALEPVIGTALTMLREFPGCRLARMSGSGATCFALFAETAAAAAAAKVLGAKFPHWWIRATTLG
jgi:4-diphosphocytidyl-2-C-methyl-D-erythritol kinase